MIEAKKEHYLLEVLDFERFYNVLLLKDYIAFKLNKEKYCVASLSDYVQMRRLPDGIERPVLIN